MEDRQHATIGLDQILISTAGEERSISWAYGVSAVMINEPQHRSKTLPFGVPDVGI
jgi:hypothetical protein